MYVSSLLRVSVALLIGLLATPAAAQEVFTFKSLVYQDRYIRHQDFLGELTLLSSELDREDAKFIQRPALSGTPGAVSFEAANHRGYFLRHQEFRVKLQSDDGTPAFNSDASFFPRTGLANPAGVSFEAVNFPGYFIRHFEFHLWVNKDDHSTTDFWRDATFLRQGAPLEWCRLWDLSGPWEIVQDNDWSVHLALKQTGGKIGGTGSYCEGCGQSAGFISADKKSIEGTVAGTTDWDKFIFAIRWPGSKLGGEYRGDVHADGTITGITVNQDQPGDSTAFHSDRGSASCINADATVSTPPSSAPPASPVKILGKRKIPAPEPAATGASKSGVEVGAGQGVGDIVAPRTCQPGFVPRGAGPNDRVCVTPAEHALAVRENSETSTHVDPNGAYGPNTCLSGYVWRNAFDSDGVCVTPDARDRVAAENRLGPSHAAGQ